MNRKNSTHADYGLDAPTVIRNLIIMGLVLVATGAAAYWLLDSWQKIVAVGLLIWGVLAGGSMLVTAVLMIRSSQTGKIRELERLLDYLNLRGDESVLDMGTGRGVLLIGAAKRLTTGTATGVDLWRTQDQSGNDPDVTLANARAEGVADRIKVETADMRQLPFSDASMDVVVSSLAIHNIPDVHGRSQALGEINRVLKGNGRIALLDFQHTDEYVQALHGLGWQQVNLSRRQWGMFPPVRIVTGQKPAEMGLTITTHKTGNGMLNVKGKQ